MLLFGCVIRCFSVCLFAIRVFVMVWCGGVCVFIGRKMGVWASGFVCMGVFGGWLVIKNTAVSGA